MAAYIWNTNHRMWSIVAPFTDSLDVLKAYIVDPAAYVYWSTPRLFDEIAVGDIAYIYCTVDNQGIVASGRVEERARELTHASASEFAFPARLTPAGWNETVAPSSWKTGIRIARTFWERPVNPPGFDMPHGTINRLGEAEARAIEAAIGAK